MTRLACRCGASWETRDVSLFKAHIARCTDAKRITAREDADRERRQDADADDDAKNADYELTPYEKSKRQEWSRTCTPEEAARRLNALVKGRLAAIKKSRAAAQSIGNPQPAPAPDGDVDTFDELLRQRGTGSIGSRFNLEGEE